MGSVTCAETRFIETRSVCETIRGVLIKEHLSNLIVHTTKHCYTVTVYPILFLTGFHTFLVMERLKKLTLSISELLSVHPAHLEAFLQAAFYINM